MEQKEKKKLWKWLVIAVAFIFFAFMAILPFAWEDGDDVPAPNPTIVNFQRFPTLDAKKLVNAPKMSAHHRGICHF